MKKKAKKFDGPIPYQKALINSLKEGIAFFDKKEKVILVNPALMQMTGLPQDGFYLSEFTKLLSGKSVKSGSKKTIDLNKEIARTLKTGNPAKIDEVNLAGFTYEFLITPVQDDEKRTIGGAIILHDITHMKEISRMESEFISTASHQLRTPMTGIQWVIERLLKKEKLTKKGREYLKDIHSSIMKLTALIDLLLNVSRIEGGRVGISPKSLDVVEFLEGYLVECIPLGAKKHLAIEFKQHPKKLEVTSDTGALRNIFQSIISNAIEYTPKNGRIIISLEKKDDHFVFCTADTGIGVPEDEQKNIFDKFTRGSNAKLVKTDGTGLGLHIAKEASGLLGGAIWLESPVKEKILTQDGKRNPGAKFCVGLPLKSQERKGSRSFA